MLIEGSFEEVDDKECLVSGCSVTGTIVNFCCGIRHAPPLIHTCIVPEGAACLYALFEWGLTELFQEIQDFENGLFSCPSIYIITPFSVVKNEIKKDLKKRLFENIYEWINSSIGVEGTDENAFMLENTYKEEAEIFKKWYKTWLEENVGTVHTFQGKEANIVYFLTGTDASKINAAEWACKEPNLLNVAVTRAKDEFYIIGDQPLLERFSNYKIISDIMTEFILRNY